VVIYGVISSAIEKPVDLLPSREEAEAFIAEVEADDPELAGPAKGREDRVRLAVEAADDPAPNGHLGSSGGWE
jgi:hypothetical protein